MPHNNKKCEYDGYLFDSHAEMNDYIVHLSNTGVKQVIVKPKFILQPGFTSFDHKKIRPITFSPDLMVAWNINYKDSKGISYDIRDTKPYNKKYRKFITEEVFNIKWKMLQYIFANSTKISFLSPTFGNEIAYIDTENKLISFTLTS